MFCSLCKSEYRPGFTRCADCAIDLVEVLPSPNEESRDRPEDENPFLAPTRYFLAWFVTSSVYLFSILAVRVRPFLRGNLVFVLFFLVCMSMVALSGGFWMLVQVVTYERRIRRYVLLSFVPFMFVWYWLVRAPLPREPVRGAARRRVVSDVTASMFCPLCKAGFRQGFTQCSDCRVPLVPTSQEADAIPITCVWKGGNKHDFESILTALQDAKIPLVFRERLKVENAAKMTFSAMFSHRAGTSDTEFGIHVLQSDAQRAAAAVHEVLAPAEENND